MPKKYILTLNAAERRLQLLLSNGESILYAEDLTPSKGGTEQLVLSIHSACTKLGITVSDISHIASVVGPGNFMGIRLTAVTASALARANSVLQAPLDYMQCVAANVPARPGELVRVVTTATKSLVHTADFLFNDAGTPVALGQTSLAPIPDGVFKKHVFENQESETQEKQASFLYPNYLIGSGLTAHLTHFQNAYPPSVHYIPSTFDNPSIDALFRVTSLASWQKEDVVPIYLKQCDALENLNHIAVSQGRSPEAAHAELERLLKLINTK